MNETYSSNEKEIDLRDLMFYCLKKWRWIAAAMIITALLAGAYKYRSVVLANEQKMEAEKLKEQEGDKEDVIINPNIVYYQNAITKGEEDIKKKDDYLNNSVVMQLDANHLQTGTLSFYLNVEEEDTNTLDALVSAYRAYITDGRLAEQLHEEDTDISKTDLQYLIAFTNRKIDYTLPEESAVFNWPEKNVFQVQLTAPNAELCSTWLRTAETAIIEYSGELQEDISGHELRLLASSLTERMDQNIQTYQTQVLTDYTTAVKNLQTLRNDLETVRSEEGETIVVNETTVMEEPVNVAVKFSVMGALIGAAMAVLFLAISYVMGGKLQNIDAFENEYGMKLLGRISAPDFEKKWFGFLDRFIWKLEEGVFADIPREEQMKIAVSNVKSAISKSENVKKIMLAGTIAEKETADIYNQLKKEIKGIQFSEYRQIVFNALALEEVDTYDAVLFLEKKRISASKLIIQERAQVVSRNVPVLGTVVL